MYSYNLIIKTGNFDEADARILAHRELVRRFGPAVHYYFHARTVDAIVAVVSDESKRNLQSTLGDWFTEHGSEPPYPMGALLHYREILRDEPTHILNRPIGG